MLMHKRMQKRTHEEMALAIKLMLKQTNWEITSSVTGNGMYCFVIHFCPKNETDVQRHYTYFHPELTDNQILTKLTNAGLVEPFQ